MADIDPRGLADISADVDNLFREETFTDLQAASIRRLTPVDANGEHDPKRSMMYIGETTLVTQMGPLPVQFPIEAETLASAFEQFSAGVNEALERLNERAKEMARDEASRIVVPSGMPPGMAGGMPPGGGKIVL